MEFTFGCRKCGHIHSVDDSLGGQSLTCLGCGQSMVVPAIEVLTPPPRQSAITQVTGAPVVASPANPPNDSKQPFSSPSEAAQHTVSANEAALAPTKSQPPTPSATPNSTIHLCDTPVPAAAAEPLPETRLAASESFDDALPMAELAPAPDPAPIDDDLPMAELAPIDDAVPIDELAEFQSPLSPLTQPGPFVGQEDALAANSLSGVQPISPVRPTAVSAVGPMAPANPRSMSPQNSNVRPGQPATLTQPVHPSAPRDDLPGYQLNSTEPAAPPRRPPRYLLHNPSSTELVGPNHGSWSFPVHRVLGGMAAAFGGLILFNYFANSSVAPVGASAAYKSGHAAGQAVAFFFGLVLFFVGAYYLIMGDDS